jgi:DNA-binding beta-propeller fold protein YncE
MTGMPVRIWNGREQSGSAWLAVCVVFLAGAGLAAQRPTDSALLAPQVAPPLDYVAVPNAITLPPGVTTGPTASAAFDAAGHLIVLTRGPEAIFEFDAKGAFLRSYGGSLFMRSHGLRVDPAGNLWATDVGAHVVYKLDRQGRVLLTLGTKGEAGEWNESTGSHKLNQPTDIALAPNGDVFVSEGHTPGADGDARVLKFDKTGRLLMQWGGKGSEPGKFQVAHGLAIDGRGQLWVMDRENQRIQLFTQNGVFVREMKYAGLPCSVAFGKRYAYMANGFAGQVVRMDGEGKVLAVIGRPGQGLGEFGEAHVIAVSPKDEVLVADSANGSLVKFVPRR